PGRSGHPRHALSTSPPRSYPLRFFSDLYKNNEFLVGKIRTYIVSVRCCCGLSLPRRRTPCLFAGVLRKRQPPYRMGRILGQGVLSCRLLWTPLNSLLTITKHTPLR